MLARNFIGRHEKTGPVRGSNGVVHQVEASDITVTRLTTGKYRCYKCPAIPIDLDGNHLMHMTHTHAAEMVLHIVDHHVMAGHRVGLTGLKRLAAEAVRNAG